MDKPTHHPSPMGADPAVPGPPDRRLGEYTTWELTTYRRELEHAIRRIPDTAPVQADLRSRLADVETEEQSRARLAAANGRG